MANQAKVRTLAMLVLGAYPSACTPAPRFVFDHGAVVRADTSRSELALVFTGGEFGEGTAHVLDVLRETGVKASFFLTGAFLANAAQRHLVTRMVDAGHFVGPHSHGHPLYCPWDDRSRSLVGRADFHADLRRNIADLRTLGALRDPTPIYFIPPYEWFNEDHVRWAAELGVTLINYSPGSGSNRDYIPEGQHGFVPSTEILADILTFEQKASHGLNGFFLLLHLGSQRRDKMHLQLAPLIRELHTRGYQFRRLDELLLSRRSILPAGKVSRGENGPSGRMDRLGSLLPRASEFGSDRCGRRPGP